MWLWWLCIVNILFYCSKYLILLWYLYYFIVLKTKIDSLLLKHGLLVQQLMQCQLTKHLLNKYIFFNVTRLYRSMHWKRCIELNKNKKKKKQKKKQNKTKQKQTQTIQFQHSCRTYTFYFALEKVQHWTCEHIIWKRTPMSRIQKLTKENLQYRLCIHVLYGNDWFPHLFIKAYIWHTNLDG